MENQADVLAECEAEILRLCSGNEAAVQLINGFWKRCEIWDDLVDQDKPVTPAEVNELVLWALFEIQLNPVYQANPALQLLLRVVVANWFASNVLERGDRDGKATSFALRCSPYDFFVGVVLTVSGAAMADEAALYFRSLKGAKTIDDYLERSI